MEPLGQNSGGGTASLLSCGEATSKRLTCLERVTLFQGWKHHGQKEA